MVFSPNVEEEAEEEEEEEEEGKETQRQRIYMQAACSASLHCVLSCTLLLRACTGRLMQCDTQAHEVIRKIDLNPELSLM